MADGGAAAARTLPAGRTSGSGIHGGHQSSSGFRRDSVDTRGFQTLSSESGLRISDDCRIVPVMPENVFCSKCGAQNAASAAFCPSCGASMSVGAPAVATAAPAAVYPPPAVAAPYSPYGGFWIRVGAYLLDGVIIGAVTVPLALIFLLPSIIKIIHAAEESQQPPPEMFAAF